MSERVRVVQGGEGRLVAVKSPPAADPDRTKREVDLLRVLRHPGVVELVDGQQATRRVEVWTHWVGSRSTADLTTPLDPDLAAGLALAVGRTLQDLHRLGLVHGSLDPSHVLLDPRGRPVLCGFGGAATVGEALPPDDLGLDPDTTAEPAVDVAGLGGLLTAWLDPAPGPDASLERPVGAARRRTTRSRPSGRTRQLLAIAEHASRPDPLDRPGMQALLDAIRSAAPSATLGPGADADDPSSATPRSPMTAPAVDGSAERDGWAGEPTTGDATALATGGPDPVTPLIDAPVATGPAEADGGLPDPDVALLDPGDRGMWDELHGIRPRADDRPAGRGRWRAGAAASVAALVGFIVVSGVLTWPSGGGAGPPTAPLAEPSTTTPATTRPTPSTTAPRATTSPPTTPTTSAAAPAAAPTDAPVVVHEDRRYQVGVAGDLAVVGDWRCDGSALVALYRPSSGSVFVFHSWPRPGERVESTAVTVTPAGTAVGADPRPDGCVDLVVRDGASELARFGPGDLT
jgi:hypothetical protein